MGNSTAISDKKQTAALATLADEINTHHRQCEAAMRSGLEHALAAGRLLAEAKSQLPHGDWGRWLAENFAGSDRSPHIDLFAALLPVRYQYNFDDRGRLTLNIVRTEAAA